MPSSSAEVEQALILAETALGAAVQEQKTAEVAKAAAGEAALLAQTALDAAQVAYDYAEQARNDRRAALVTGMARAGCPNVGTRARDRTYSR